MVSQSACYSLFATSQSVTISKFLPAVGAPPTFLPVVGPPTDRVQTDALFVALLDALLVETSTLCRLQLPSSWRRRHYMRPSSLVLHIHTGKLKLFFTLTKEASSVISHYVFATPKLKKTIRGRGRGRSWNSGAGAEAGTPKNSGAGAASPVPFAPVDIPKHKEASSVISHYVFATPKLKKKIRGRGRGRSWNSGAGAGAGTPKNLGAGAASPVPFAPVDIPKHKAFNVYIL
ncbi:hypothetical protein LXL04_030752 [Taraxacum kok-saghyz]